MPNLVVDDVTVLLNADVKQANTAINALKEIGTEADRTQAKLNKLNANQGATKVKSGVDGITQAEKEAAKAAKEMEKAQTAAFKKAEKEALAYQRSIEKGNLFLGGLVVSAGVFAKSIVETSARLDSLDRSLVAIAGSSEEAEIQMSRLEKLAKKPGLGFEQVVQGSINLQSAGQSAEQAERSLAAFGNALAVAGKGKAELDGVVTALSQIQSKGVVSAEEIQQLAERLPSIRPALQAAFGTSSTEEIQALGLDVTEFVNLLTVEFEKLPQATGGLRNTLENLSDSSTRAFGALGDTIAPVAEVLANSLAFLLDSIRLVIEEFPNLSKFVGTFVALTTAVVGLRVAFLSAQGALAAMRLTLLATGASGAVALGPLLPILAAVSAAFILVKRAYDTNFAGFADLIKNVVGRVVKDLKGMYDTITGIFTALDIIIKSVFGSSASQIFERFVTGLIDLAKKAKKYTGSIIKVFGTILGPIAYIFQGIYNLTRNGLDGLFSNISNLIRGVGNVAQGVLDTVTKFVNSVIETANNAIQFFVDKTLNALLDKLNIPPVKVEFFSPKEGANVAQYFDSAADKVDNFAAKVREARAEIAAAKKANEELDNNPTAPTGGGSAKEKVDELKESIDELNEKIEENAEKAAESAEAMQGLYEEVQDNIDNIIEKQKQLNDEFQDFRLDNQADAIDKLSQRAIEIENQLQSLNDQKLELQLDLENQTDLDELEKTRAKIEEVNQQIADLNKEAAYITDLNFNVDLDDQIAELESRKVEIEANLVGLTDQNQINQAKQELSKLNDELNAVQTEKDQTGLIQAKIDELREFNNLSKAEQIEFERQRALEEKEQAVNAEQAKYEAMLDVQKRFLEVSLSEQADVQDKLAALAENASMGSLADREERARLLEELGFDELTKEQELELLKQVQRQQAIAQEIAEIRSKEEELLAIREEFLDLADEITLESVDNRIEAYNKEIAKIKELIQQINALNSLSGGSSGGGGNTTTNNNQRNLNITQNINNEVDVAAANQQLINSL